MTSFSIFPSVLPQAKRGILLRTAALAFMAAGAAACGDAGEDPAVQDEAEALSGPARPFPARPDEPRLRNVRQLTFAGENAEAYFSADGQKLIFQGKRPGQSACDQIFTMDVDGSDVTMVSTGKGRTTCAYWFPAGDRILYSSNHIQTDTCPAPPDYSLGYVWPLDDHDVFLANPDGSDLQRLTEEPGYDAEATVSPDGRTIVFTSARDGDLDIYTMNADGSNVRRLTDEPGYDGGPFFSPDGSRIVYRAYHPTDPAAVEDFRSLLGQGLVRPTQLDIFVMDADGSNKRQVTDNGAANFAPFFHPSGEKILFSSNLRDPEGRNFDLFLINVDGTGLERVTTFESFDGFPMFSPDGRYLVFGSNRGAATEGDTNVFMAEWVDELPAAAASGG